ncbi:MAG: hypothetical protein KGJ10_06660 [Acidobacteriota bacterium]|nr:hypothetical protein [Acidobacteriota bacterium]
MTPEELSRQIAHPIQTLGMSFYFDPLTSERAKTHGLNVFEFYGLGRGGVLGDVDAAVVAKAFTFFDDRTIDFLYTKARAKADPVAIAADYVQAAYAFADQTFGDLDPSALARFGANVRRVVDQLAPGRCPLVDGYRQYDAPSDPVHAAYLGTIFLRELRGGVHIEAIDEVGLSAKEAAYLQDESVYKLHGYAEDDKPVVTPELEAAKREAEERTTAKEAACLAVLSETERDEVAEVTALMFAALANPVAVTR